MTTDTTTVETKIEHNYLREQFADADRIWSKIRAVVERGDFTLGLELSTLETHWAAEVGTRHAIGVNSGTDALILGLKALGVKGEVIVPAFGFIATAAAVKMAGAQIRFCDIGDDFNIDPADAERRVTPATDAVIAVHWAGRPCDMKAVTGMARLHGISVVEDAAHAIGSRSGIVACGAFGDFAGFSLHPLKNVNVWGDGGVITTDDTVLADKIKLWRNHGLLDRNTCKHWGHNSRLDTVQAVVAAHVLAKMPAARFRRQANAALLSSHLAGIDQIVLPTPRQTDMPNWYLYSMRVRERRDELCAWLNQHGVDAKVHYPTPLPYQPAASYLNHKPGDFPGAERACAETLSLPVHEYIVGDQIDRMADLIRRFYGG